MGLHVVQVGHDFAEDLLRFFVEIGHHDPGCQDGVIRMFGGHRGGSFGSQVVKFDRGHAGVDAVDDLNGDGDGVDEVHVESVAEFLDPRSDLVEVDELPAAVPLEDNHPGVVLHHFDKICFLSLLKKVLRKVKFTSHSRIASVDGFHV